jgi:hypothetical protein
MGMSPWPVRTASIESLSDRLAELSIEVGQP